MDTHSVHERLDCYRLACEVARWFRSTPFPAGYSHLRDQGGRAAESLVLNLAEGCYQVGKRRKQHFRIAIGSAAEACAVLDLVDLSQGPSRQQVLRRVMAMTHKLR